MLKRNFLSRVAKSNKLILFAVMIFMIIELPSMYIFEQKVRSKIYHTAQIEIKRELETKTLSLKKHFTDSVNAIRCLDATAPIKAISRISENQL